MVGLKLNLEYTGIDTRKILDYEKEVRKIN